MHKSIRHVQAELSMSNTRSDILTSIPPLPVPPPLHPSPKPIFTDNSLQTELYNKLTDSHNYLLMR